MSKHALLTILLVLHFLPWPGAEFVLSCIDMPVRVVTNCSDEECQNTPPRPGSQVHELWPGHDEIVVYLEMDNELTEKEEKSERDDDSQLDLALVWQTPVEINAINIGIMHSQSARFFASNILSVFQILRC